MTEYGTNISIGRVYRLMKHMQLPKMSTIKPKPIANQSADEALCQNLLKQQFNPVAPNQVWVSDITYIKTGNSFSYLCVIIDLFSRKVIAYNISRRMDTSLVLDTFEKAYVSRKVPSGVLFHSDRGTQYTAWDFRKRLDHVNFIQSFSAKAHPYDNAVAESFFKFLKHEETNRRTFRCLKEVELSLFEHRNFYNNQRPNSTNDGLIPHEKERDYYENL